VPVWVSSRIFIISCLSCRRGAVSLSVHQTCPLVIFARNTADAMRRWRTPFLSGCHERTPKAVLRAEDCPRVVVIGVTGELWQTAFTWDITQISDFESFVGGLAKLRKATISFVISGRPHGNNLAPTGRIFVKFDI
jgi:hypothetical protein